MNTDQAGKACGVHLFVKAKLLAMHHPRINALTVVLVKLLVLS